MSAFKILDAIDENDLFYSYSPIDDIGVPCMIKYYRKDNEFLKSCFHKEVSTYSHLKHENLLENIDFGEDEDGLWLKFPYSEYESLGKRIKNKGALDLERSFLVL